MPKPPASLPTAARAGASRVKAASKRQSKARSAAPSARRGNRKMLQILQAARQEFLLHGYGTANMDDVALKANVSKATLYVYFGSKQDLFAATIEHERERYGGLLLAGGAGREHIRVKLLRIANTIVDFLLSDETVASYRMVVAEASRLPDVGQAFYSNGPVKFLDRLEEFIAKSMQAGVLRTDDPRRAAEQLIGLVRGDLQLRALLGVTDGMTRSRIDAIVNHGVDAFYRLYQPDAE